MYKPLPKQLRLGFSDIHDIGVFAKEGIAQGTNLGMTHLKVADHIYRRYELPQCRSKLV